MGREGKGRGEDKGGEARDGVKGRWRERKERIESACERIWKEMRIAFDSRFNRKQEHTQQQVNRMSHYSRVKQIKNTGKFHQHMEQLAQSTPHTTDNTQ